MKLWLKHRNMTSKERDPQIIPAWMLWSQRRTGPSQWTGKCVGAQFRPRPSRSADRPETGTHLRALTPGWRAPPSPRGPELVAGRWNSLPGRTAVATAATGAPEARSLTGNTVRESWCGEWQRGVLNVWNCFNFSKFVWNFVIIKHLNSWVMVKIWIVRSEWSQFILEPVLMTQPFLQHTALNLLFIKNLL